MRGGITATPVRTEPPRVPSQMSVSQSVSQSVTDLRTGATLDHARAHRVLTAARGSVRVSASEMDGGERKVTRFRDAPARFTPASVTLALALAALAGLKCETTNNSDFCDQTLSCV